MMKKTGAKLIWITSTPIPDGCGKVGALKNGRVPGRKGGAVTKYLNPWAMEVVGADPAISICDLWDVVDRGRNSQYKKWCKGWDRHIQGSLSDPLGQKLARSMVEILGMEKGKK